VLNLNHYKLRWHVGCVDSFLLHANKCKSYDVGNYARPPVQPVRSLESFMHRPAKFTRTSSFTYTNSVENSYRFVIISSAKGQQRSRFRSLCTGFRRNFAFSDCTSVFALWNSYYFGHTERFCDLLTSLPVTNCSVLSCGRPHRSHYCLCPSVPTSSVCLSHTDFLTRGRKWLNVAWEFYFKGRTSRFFCYVKGTAPPPKINKHDCRDAWPNILNKKAQLTQRERTTAVHVWRPTANKCKIRKNIYSSAQGHSRLLLSVSIETRVWLPISD